jgi:hypothetical protein
LARRIERKLQEVVVAQYSWRHEAEFAAGFLKDADIPYRLQIDDPALGISVGSAAALWVLGADEARAREVLDINEQHAPRLTTPRSANHPARPAIRPSGSDAVDAFAAKYAAFRPEHGVGASRLPFRARILSILGGMAIAGVSRAVFPQWPSPALEATVGVVAVILILVGIIGWAPRALRELLRALSGNAP